MNSVAGIYLPTIDYYQKIFRGEITIGTDLIYYNSIDLMRSYRIRMHIDLFYV